MLHPTAAGAFDIFADIVALRDGSSWAQTGAPSESRVFSFITCWLPMTTTHDVDIRYAATSNAEHRVGDIFFHYSLPLHVMPLGFG